MQLSSRINTSYFGSQLSIPPKTHLKDIEQQLAKWQQENRLSEIVASIAVNNPEPNRVEYSLIIVPTLLPESAGKQLGKEGLQPDIINGVTIDNLENKLLNKRHLREYA